MAIRRKGYRRIVVDGVAYLWRTPRKVHRMDWEGDPGFIVVVQTEDRQGSALAIQFPHRHPKVAALFGTPVVSLVPSMVASGIRRGLAAGWQPTVRKPFWFHVAGGRPNAGDADTPHESWLWMADYYEGFSKRTCGFLAPLIAAVEWASGSEWGVRFWATPSRYTLIVSPFSRWPDRQAGPRLVVAPERGEMMSVQRYTTALLQPFDSVACSAAECRPAIEAGLVWLAEQWPATPRPC